MDETAIGDTTATPSFALKTVKQEMVETAISSNCHDFTVKNSKVAITNSESIAMPDKKPTGLLLAALMAKSPVSRNVNQLFRINYDSSQEITTDLITSDRRIFYEHHDNGDNGKMVDGIVDTQTPSIVKFHNSRKMHDENVRTCREYSSMEAAAGSVTLIPVKKESAEYDHVDPLQTATTIIANPADVKSALDINSSFSLGQNVWYELPTSEGEESCSGSTDENSQSDKNAAQATCNTQEEMTFETPIKLLINECSLKFGPPDQSGFLTLSEPKGVEAVTHSINDNEYRLDVNEIPAKSMSLAALTMTTAEENNHLASELSCKHASSNHSANEQIVMDEENYFQCHDKIFPASSRQNQHEGHTGKKPYSCTHCSKTFTTKYNCMAHEKIHTGEKPYSCAYCNKKFTKKCHCMVHERIHTGEKPYPCVYCGKTFAEKQHCMKHEKIHTGEKCYSCTHCNKKFINKRNCQVHERIHTGEKPYSCTYCGRKFTEKQQCMRHERIHTGDKPYSCTHCSKTFTTKFNCVAHEKIHTGEKPYSCAYCNKKFTKKCHCMVHERIHTGEKPYSCMYCGKTFVEKQHCMQHEKVHTGEKSYSCMHCNKKFINKRNCHAHERIHTGEKPYSCMYCGRKFTEKQQVMRHERIHTGEKPYSCTLCDKKFIQKSDCTKHEKVHTGEKSHSCTHCNKKFVSNRNCIEHERIHTGEKPYSCTFCSKKFRHKNRWVDHERTHTGEKLVPVQTMT